MDTQHAAESVTSLSSVAINCIQNHPVRGELAERFIAPVLKTGIPERVSGVRIPRSPPFHSSRTLRITPHPSTI